METPILTMDDLLVLRSGIDKTQLTWRFFFKFCLEDFRNHCLSYRRVHEDV